MPSLRVVGVDQHEPLVTVNGELSLPPHQIQDVTLCAGSGNLIAVCTSDKHLRVFAKQAAHDLKVEHILPKRITSVSFDHASAKIIVSDAFGDVYRLPLTESVNVRDSDDEKHLLLGHCCSIIDVCISNNLVATCDRDAKIRVSGYPDAFVIQSFCLGHSEFVSCLEFIPLTTSYSSPRLLSGGADGKVAVWNSDSGKQLAVIDIMQYEVVKQSVEDRALITKMCVVSSDMLVFSLHNSSTLFGISGLKSNKLQEVRAISEHNGPISSLQHASGKLWVSSGEDANSVYQVDVTDVLGSWARNVVIKESQARHVSYDRSAGESSDVESRFEWLARQWKKEMVDNWKGKKRRRLEK